MIQRISILLTLVFASIAYGQPMAERVPADAVVYVGWQGTDSLNGYENSHLKGVIDSSNLLEKSATHTGCTRENGLSGSTSRIRCDRIAASSG